MNVYNKILVELNKNSTLKQQYNNLVKLRYSTEERELRKYIDAWLNVLDGAENFRLRKLYARTSELLNSSSNIKQNLIDYCNDVIWSKKPEWQILAERNDWRPPV